MNPFGVGVHKLNLLHKRSARSATGALTSVGCSQKARQNHFEFSSRNAHDGVSFEGKGDSR